MSDICTWPSCGHTAKGQCQPNKPITAHPFESVIVSTLEAEIARLKAEVERLREALEEIVKPGGADDFWQCYDIARAALNPSQEPRT
jgi:hypothetical protein